jgi:FkbM family methyltransferase
VQAQPAELPTRSLQALKLRAHQLLESQRSLQQQNQALAAERLGLESERNQQATQYQELSAERDALQAERDSLTTHLQELTAQRDSIQQQWETLLTKVEDLQGQLTAQSVQTAEQSQQRESLQMNEFLAQIESLTNKFNELSQAEASAAARLNEASAKLQFHKKMAEAHLNDKNLLAAYCEQLEKEAREPAHFNNLISDWEAPKYSRENLRERDIPASLDQVSMISWIQRTIYIGLTAFGSHGPYAAEDAIYGSLFPPFLTDAQAENGPHPDESTEPFNPINSSASKLVKFFTEYKKTGNLCSFPLVNSGILLPFGPSTRHAQHNLEISDSLAGPIFHLGKSDLVSNSLIIYGEWAQNEIEFLSYFVTPGSMVIDVGAYLGTHSRAFADIVGKTGIVYAFEPNPVSYQLLLLNSSLSCGARIAPYCIALGDRDAKFYIESSDFSNLGASTVSQSPDLFKCAVPTKRLDSFKLGDELCLSLIKIDVEGAETKVLDGAADLIADQKPIIYVEVNDPEVASRIYEWGDQHSLCAFGCTHSAYNADNHNAFKTDLFSNAHEFGLILISPAKLTRQISDYLRCKKFIELSSTSDARNFLEQANSI